MRLILMASLATLVAGNATAQTETVTSEDDQQRLGTIFVTSRAQQLYRVEETVTGKLPTEPLTSSLTVTTITDELIEDQGARDAQDLYRNISGVTLFSYAGVTARGFRQEENFFDGLRGDPYSGFSVPQLFNVERVEFLKGPAGMLYGPGAPGGLFNYVSKKPEDGFSADTSLVYGTEGRKGASVELNDDLPVDGASGRIGAFYEEGGQPRWNTDSEVAILDAGLSFDVGPGELVLQATRYDQDLQGNRLRGVPTDDAGRFLTDRRWNHNEPTDYLRLESDVLQAIYTGQVSDAFSFDAKLRWNENKEVQQYHEPRGLFDSDGDGALDASIREFRDQERTNESLSFGTNGIWSHDFGVISNRLLVGADWFEQDNTFTGFSLRGTTTDTAGLPTPLSLIDPQYGITDPSTYALPPREDYRQTLNEQTRYGLYAIDEVTIGKLIATLGVRQDWFEDRDITSQTSFEDSSTTWRAGLVYRLRDDVSVFGQWAESFEPQSISSQNPLAGGPFEPTSGEIYEGGVRTELMDGRVQSSASVYQIKRTNILQSDPRGDTGGDGVDDLVSFGEVTSEGFELDVTADITANWVGTVTYGYNDTRITEDNGGGGLGLTVGDRFANAPKHQAGFWTRYQVPAWDIAFALGGDYVDVRRSISGQKVRPYTIFDASVIYEPGPFKLLLRADNLFDETYAASGFIARTGHFPGAPRSVFVELSKSW